MASNAADHKHNITQVSQFARILSFRELLRHRRLFHLPAALLCVPAYFELSYHLWSRLSSRELGLWWEWIFFILFYFILFIFYFNKQQIKYKLKVTKERKTTKQKQQQQQKKHQLRGEQQAKSK